MSSNREPVSLTEWRRRAEQSQQEAERKRQERPGWSPRPSDYVKLPFLAVVVCLMILVTGFILIQVVSFI